MIFRNHQGHILLINAGSLGHTMNNVAELWGLTRGLQLANEHNFTKLIVEGDSLVIINLFKRILNGADSYQISPYWRLSHGLKTIMNLLQPNQALIPSHIRRKANQIADDLANLGMNWDGPKLLCQASLNLLHPIHQHCKHKATVVDKAPDQVMVRDTWQNEEAHTGQRGEGHVTDPCQAQPPPPCN